MEKQARRSIGSPALEAPPPPLSVVVIGRDEAQNLPACIRSIREMDYPQDRLEVVYVDTDSTDGSPEVARSLGVTVYEEHSAFPSPGRARNRGWREARCELVHFIDGDMTIAPGYLREAVRQLGRDSVVCVIGLLDERYERQNLLSRLLHRDWDGKTPGDVDAPAAGGTFLTRALREVGGYNPEILRAEETDIGLRLRERGYRIVLIDEVMGVHDYGVRTLAGLFRRFYGSIGYHFGRVLQLPPSPSLAHEQRAARRNVVECAGAVVALVLSVALGWWRALALGPLALPLYVAVKYWQPPARRRKRIVYFLVEYLGKPAIWAGMVGYWWKRRATGRSAGPVAASDWAGGAPTGSDIAGEPRGLGPAA